MEGSPVSFQHRSVPNQRVKKLFDSLLRHMAILLCAHTVVPYVLRFVLEAINLVGTICFWGFLFCSHPTLKDTTIHAQPYVETCRCHYAS